MAPGILVQFASSSVFPAGLSSEGEVTGEPCTGGLDPGKAGTTRFCLEVGRESDKEDCLRDKGGLERESTASVVENRLLLQRRRDEPAKEAGEEE